MLRTTDAFDKGGHDYEAAFDEAYPCMEHDERFYDGEYRCRFSDQRYDVKSGFRINTMNVAVAAQQWLHQIERAERVHSVAYILGEWRVLDADSLLATMPAIRTRKAGYSDTHYILAAARHWNEFIHEHPQLTSGKG